MDAGNIQLIIGGMFSGKSTELLRRVRRVQVQGKNCLIIKYAKDNRYTKEELMLTHDAQQIKAVPVIQLKEVEQLAKNYDVIAIDEGQFFEDIVEFSENCANSGQRVIVAALDSTYERKPFGNIHNLLCKSEDVQKLRSICSYCKEEGSFTLRTVDCNETELIGGAELYKAVCRKCFLKHHQQGEGVVIQEKLQQLQSSQNSKCLLEKAVGKAKDNDVDSNQNLQQHKRRKLYQNDVEQFQDRLCSQEVKRFQDIEGQDAIQQESIIT